MISRNRSVKITILTVVSICLLLFVFSIELEKRTVLEADGSIASGGGYRWGVEAIKAPQVWDVTKGSPSVVVAVIDGGINFELPALEGHCWTNKKERPDSGKDESGTGYADDRHGWDFRKNQPVSSSDTSNYYHGTFVAGLIASRNEPDLGTTGVAPGVKLMDLRVLNSRGRAFSSDWPKFASAIRYAAENGAEIINLSLSAKARPPEVVRKAINFAHRQGVLVVSSAGNSSGNVQSLAQLEGVTSVGSVGPDESPASFSSPGEGIDLVAPGEEVLSFKEGEPATGSGTSFASAHVSGAAALLLSAYPDVEKKSVLKAFRRTAEEFRVSDGESKRGLIDLNRAFRELKARSS